MVVQVVEKNYWYYSNGSYELESTVDSQGDRTSLNRHISGPMPESEILDIVKSNQLIPLNAQNWPAQVVQRLASERFNTQGLLNGIGQEIGVRLCEYIKSFFNIKTAKKTALVAGGIGIIFFSPALLTKFAPDLSSQLGLSALASSRNVVVYSCKEWAKLGISSCRFVTTGMVTYTVITAVGLRLFTKLIEEVGPKRFRAWRAVKLDIFIREPLIPVEFSQDPFLSQYECPITYAPICVPVRARCGHLFEEAAIRGWYVQQVANGIVPRCPMRCIALNLQLDFGVDHALADQIQLRILLLKSHLA